MSDVVQVALVTGFYSLIVAVTSVLAQYFGPEWRDARARKREAAASEVARRYERALGFVEALAGEAGRKAPTRAAVLAARTRFVAVLRPGEQAAEVFTRRLIDRAFATSPREARLEYLDRQADKLFQWLRGDAGGEVLEIEQTHRGTRILVNGDMQIHVTPASPRAPREATQIVDSPAQEDVAPAP